MTKKERELLRELVEKVKGCVRKEIYSPRDNRGRLYRRATLAQRRWNGIGGGVRS